MDVRRLGTSDLAITPIGLGTWAIGGGDWVCGWGPQKDAISIATIRRAIDCGINWIDTAGVYGLGQAETIVGRALRGLPHRERPLVCVSCGLVWDDLGNVSHNLRAASIRREAEGSLRRLGIDAIDLYQLGWPSWTYSPRGHDPGPIEDAWDAMATLQREGKVRHLGVSNCDVDRLARLEAIAPVTFVQEFYSLLCRQIETSTVPFCQHRGIAVVAYSPLQSGLLTGCMTPDRVKRLPHNDWRRRSSCFQEPAIAQAMHVVDRLRAVGQRLGPTPAALAVAWTLRDQSITATVVGARQPDQIEEIARAATLRLSPEDVQELESATTAGVAQSLRA